LKNDQILKNDPKKVHKNWVNFP